MAACSGVFGRAQPKSLYSKPRLWHGLIIGFEEVVMGIFLRWLGAFLLLAATYTLLFRAHTNLRIRQ